MAVKVTPVVRQVIKSVGAGEKIIPVIRSYMIAKDFPSFTVHVRGSEQRKPDGWFHPSTHPLWTERQLYYYLSFPELVVGEILDPLSTMAVTAGSFWHSFVTVCLMESGYLLDHDVKVCDEERKSRGEMDGRSIDEAWEFKTMNGAKMGTIPHGGPGDPEVIGWLMKKCPDYYAQAQEYLRLSGFRIMRFLIMATEYPFPMREIAVPTNEAFQYQIASKYARVLQAVADQVPPEPCCGPGSKQARECPVRMSCPVGRM